MKSGIVKILPLVTLALLSCVSFTPVYLDLSTLALEGTGQGLISEIEDNDGGLLIRDKAQDKEIAIRLKGDVPPGIIAGLKGAGAYDFRSRIRPDGPVESLILSDETGLLAYLGDGLRPGRLPGLELGFEAASENSIRIISSEGKGTVKTGQPTDILIEGIPFTSYLLNTQRGNPEFDQPPFKADLILIRK